jgi:hypothetical protein
MGSRHSCAESLGRGSRQSRLLCRPSGAGSALPRAPSRHRLCESIQPCAEWVRLSAHASIPVVRFHCTPPLLGFFDEIFSCSFVPITEALPFSKVAFDCRPWHPIDCHHSRVLLYKDSVLCGYFLVWDPITGEREQVREASSWGRSCDSAVVLCATAGCDHCDCHGGPFLIVSVSTCRVRDSVEARVYSSQVGAWGDLVSVQLDVILNCDWNRIDLRSGALVGDGVHFLLALSGGWW